MRTAVPLLGRMSAWMRRWRECGRRLVAICLDRVRRWLMPRSVLPADPRGWGVSPTSDSEADIRNAGHTAPADSSPTQSAQSVSPPPCEQRAPRRRRSATEAKPRRRRPAEPAAVPPLATPVEPASPIPSDTPWTNDSPRPTSPPAVAPWSLTPDDLVRLVALLADENQVQNVNAPRPVTTWGASAPTPPAGRTKAAAAPQPGSLWPYLLAAIIGWLLGSLLDLPPPVFHREPERVIPQERAISSAAAIEIPRGGISVSGRRPRSALRWDSLETPAQLLRRPALLEAIGLSETAPPVVFGVTRPARPGDRPPMSEPAEPSTVFDEIGADKLRDLVAAFYRQVPGDDLLGPLYPPDDLAGAEERLRDFLLFRCGGETRYLETRGHPRLRMRHAPFRVTQAVRDRWVQLMDRALDEVGLPPRADDVLRRFLHETASFLMNTPE